MRFSAALLASSVVYAIAVSVSLGAAPIQDQPKTTWDGVYSDEQAKRGESVYSQSCASCHGPDLAGLDTAPSLTGADFNTGWNDLPLSDLFERVKTTMPGDAAGSLQPQQYADVIAFLLAKDNFPAGATELPADSEALKQIKFVTKKP
jgi:mono/diheme cytochrome c family protein